MTQHSLDTERTSTTAQGANGRTERIVKQKHDMGYLEALTERNEKEQWRREWLA